MIKNGLKYSLLIDKIPSCVEKPASSKDTARSVEISGNFACQMTAPNRVREQSNKQAKNESA